VIYANNAGTSWPKPEAVYEATRAALAAPPSRWGSLFEESRAGIAGALGIAEPSELLLTSGCTAALSLGIGDLPWEAGDVVLTSALEHHALARPVQKLVWERGVVHEVAPRSEAGPIDLERVREVLAAGRVRLVACTAASNVTGELLPVRELVALAHAHGALALVDAAQAVGVVPFGVGDAPADLDPNDLGDLRGLAADLVTLAGHKGALGPQGIGGLWARRGVVFASPSAACEVGAGAREACAPRPGFCDAGSTNLAGAAGLAAGLRWLREVGGGQPRALAEALAEALGERPGCRVLGGPGPRTATLSLEVEGLGLGEAEARFAAAGVVVRAGQHCAPLALEALGVPAGTLRISFGPFNTPDDVGQILDVIDAARP
jgi:selenocysteine lyase/cysteine desulfurase